MNREEDPPSGAYALMSPVKVDLKSWASALIAVMGIWVPNHHLGCVHDLFITSLASLSPEEDPASAPGSISLCSLWGLTSGWVLPRASTVQPSVPQDPWGPGSTLVSLEGFFLKNLKFLLSSASVLVSFFPFMELRPQCCYCC